MKKLINKQIKFNTPKTSYILDKKLFYFIICDKCSNDEKIFKEE